MTLKFLNCFKIRLDLCERWSLNCFCYGATLTAQRKQPSQPRNKWLILTSIGSIQNFCSRVESELDLGFLEKSEYAFNVGSDKRLASATS